MIAAVAVVVQQHDVPSDPDRDLVESGIERSIPVAGGDSPPPIRRAPDAARWAVSSSAGVLSTRYKSALFLPLRDGVHSSSDDSLVFNTLLVLVVGGSVAVSETIR